MFSHTSSASTSSTSSLPYTTAVQSRPRSSRLNAAATSTMMSSSSLYDFSSPPSLSYIPLPPSLSSPPPYAETTVRSIDIGHFQRPSDIFDPHSQDDFAPADMSSSWSRKELPPMDSTSFSVLSHSAPTTGPSWMPSAVSSPTAAPMASSVPISPRLKSRAPPFAPTKATVPIVMSPVPLYVERLTSFYSFVDVNTLFTTITASLNQFPIEYVVSPSKAKIDAVITQSLVHLIIRLYECPQQPTSPGEATDKLICVEVQRRNGDSFAFTSLYNELMAHWKQSGLVSAMYDQTLEDESGGGDDANRQRSAEESRRSGYMDHVFPLTVDPPLLTQLTQLCLHGEINVQLEVLQCLDEAILQGHVQNALSSLIRRKIVLLQQQTPAALDAANATSSTSHATSLSDNVTALTSIHPSQLCVLTSLIHHYCATHPQVYMEMIISLLQQTATAMAALTPSASSSTSSNSSKAATSNSVSTTLYHRIIIRHLMSAILSLHALDSSSKQWSRLSTVMTSTGKQCNDLTIQSIIAQTQYQLKPVR